MYTEGAGKAREIRRTTSRRSLQKEVLSSPQARSTVAKKQEDELAQAKAVVDKADFL